MNKAMAIGLDLAKNSFALAIAEACQHSRIRSVAIKTLAQQDEVGSILKHWMGDGQQFDGGRDASAALRLCPSSTARAARRVRYRSSSAVMLR